MVKTCQFTTKYKGDRVICSKTANIILVGLHLNSQARSYQRSHVENRNSVQMRLE